MCSAMQHRGGRVRCHPGAKTPLQKTAMDCPMDCCKSTTQAIMLSSTFVLPEHAGLSYQVIATSLSLRSSIEFSNSDQVPDIPPPRTLFC